MFVSVFRALDRASQHVLLTFPGTRLDRFCFFRKVNRICKIALVMNMLPGQDMGCSSWFYSLNNVLVSEADLIHLPSLACHINHLLREKIVADFLFASLALIQVLRSHSYPRFYFVVSAKIGP